MTLGGVGGIFLVICAGVERFGAIVLNKEKKCMGKFWAFAIGFLSIFLGTIVFFTVGLKEESHCNYNSWQDFLIKLMVERGGLIFMPFVILALCWCLTKKNAESKESLDLVGFLFVKALCCVVFILPNIAVEYSQQHPTYAHASAEHKTWLRSARKVSELFLLLHHTSNFLLAVCLSRNFAQATARLTGCASGANMEAGKLNTSIHKSWVARVKRRRHRRVVPDMSTLSLVTSASAIPKTLLDRINSRRRRVFISYITESDDIPEPQSFLSASTVVQGVWSLSFNSAMHMHNLTPTTSFHGTLHTVNDLPTLNTTLSTHSHRAGSSLTPTTIALSDPALSTTAAAPSNNPDLLAAPSIDIVSCSSGSEIV
jgi:hypothetical protein